MRILWIRDGNQDEFRHYDHGNKEIDAFQRHQESMKKFRQSHPKVETPPPTEKVEADKSKNQVRVDWLGIVPLRRVQLGRFVQN